MTRYRRELSVLAAIAALAAVLAIVAPGYFARDNLRDLFLANVPVLIAALGVTLVVLSGQIDISVGSVFAICGVMAGLLAKAGLPVGAAVLAACLIGATLGGAERRARRLRAHAVDRRDAGNHGGAARRAALDHAGRVGAGLPAGLSVAGISAGDLSPAHRLDDSRSCWSSPPGRCATWRRAARCMQSAPIARPRDWPASTPPPSRAPRSRPRGPWPAWPPC